MADAKKAKKEDPKTAAKQPELKAVEAPAEGDAAIEGMDAKGGIGAKKLILFIVLPLLILAGGGAAAYFTGHLDKLLPHSQLDCTQVQEGDKDYAACAEQLATGANSLPPGVFLDIPTMIVNMAAVSKQPRYLKITIKVELESKEDQKPFEAIMPRVVDQFQAYLRELRLEDLQGSSGMYRMKIELLSRVRAAAPDVKIRDVLFQEILVQ
jgi:flagellar FliL protein